MKTFEEFIPCENCGGTGLISYNPNLNPNQFPGHATAKCSRCNGTGFESFDEQENHEIG